MTVEEWAKDFKAYINELQMPRDDYKGIIAYVEDGAKLLKAKEPVEPKTHEVVVGIYGATRNEYCCGYCGCGLINNNRWRTSFCPECGRAVKW